MRPVTPFITMPMLCGDIFSDLLWKALSVPRYDSRRTRCKRPSGAEGRRGAHPGKPAAQVLPQKEIHRSPELRRVFARKGQVSKSP
ncbi:hypothetical protein GCM10009525_32950 [Streptosporangium amethystogenes subsp. fukuiense]